MTPRTSRGFASRLFVGLVALAACGSTPAANQPSGAAGTSAPGGAGGAGTGGAAAGASAGTGAAGSIDDAGSGDATTEGTDAGPLPEPGSDGGADIEGGVDAGMGIPLPPYDGGIINVVNSGNWNETTIHPFSQRRMLVRDEGDPHLVLLDFSRPNPVVWKVVTNGPWSRGEQLIGNNQVMGSRIDGYEVFDLTTGAIVKIVQGFGNTQAAYRMANGETMLTRSGTRLDFLDKNDKIAHSISYPGFSYVRLARPTREGTFLVPSDTKVFEGDANGKVLWSLTSPVGSSWSHAFEPLLMSDGKVILSTFFGASLDVIDRTTLTVTKQYGTKTIANAATIRPTAFAEFQILPNGNFITTNWLAYSSAGVAILEFNPAGEVVWSYRADSMVFAAPQGVQVIDGLDPQFLHAQEISPDSTWQPVIPTP
jgi:hypothetical protein